MRIRNPLAVAFGACFVIALAFCVMTVLALLAERRRVADLVQDDQGLIAMLDTLDESVARSIEEHITAAQQAYELRIKELQDRMEAERQLYEGRIALLQLQSGRNDDACFQRLTALGIQFTRQPDFQSEEGCTRINTVRVAQFGQAKLSSPADMTCRLAEMMAIYERDVLQPLAAELFSSTVTEIAHVGTYNCRVIAGTNTMSEHSRANGIDLSAFTLGDGQTFDVLRDWRTDSPGAEFMRRAAYGACTIFSVALTPQFNEAHANHLHLDAGQSRACH